MGCSVSLQHNDPQHSRIGRLGDFVEHGRGCVLREQRCGGAIVQGYGQMVDKRMSKTEGFGG
jgi:hypothetical protein